MTNKEIKKILSEQLQLLAEVSNREDLYTGELPNLTSQMLQLSQLLLHLNG